MRPSLPLSIIPHSPAGLTIALLNTLVILSYVPRPISCAGDPTKCCHKGYEAAKSALTQKVNCAPSAEFLETFDEMTRGVCQGFYESCCKTTIKNLFCNQGKKIGMSGGNCAAKGTLFDKEQKTCCECCKMGVEQGRRGEECNRNLVSQIYCDAAFIKCCKKTQRRPGGAGYKPTARKIKQLATDAPPTSAPIPQTKPETAQSCAEMNCDQKTSHGCANGAYGPECQCRQGFEIDSSSKQCVDIDECNTQGVNPCSESEKCRNTFGSYKCESASQRCPFGYEKKDGGCVDVDECVRGTHKCSQFCINTEGSYNCLNRCNSPGYRVTGTNVCKDIDECSDGTATCPSNFECVNAIGSYSCKRQKCENGYTLKDEQCVDINECEVDPNICGPGGDCFNSYGRHHCNCKPGYELDIASGRCIDLDECDTSRGSFCSHDCTNTIGSYICKCPLGYVSEGAYCTDIDECATNPCQSGFHCFNNFGSYACINQACPSQFFTQTSFKQCRKKNCAGDSACAKIVERSVKWAAFRMLKTVRPNDFRFTYSLTGYLDQYNMDYYFASGNIDQAFYIKKLSREKVQIVNVKTIEGPKEYQLRMYADVTYQGQVVHRFVYTFYIYISEFNFN